MEEEEEETEKMRAGGGHPRMNYPTHVCATVKGKRDEGFGPLSVV